MSDSEEITVGAVSADGEGAVDLPVVELLTGRGFITGKSGSGKSNTASVVAEKLLDRGLSILIVDIDGEYYGLKEEYEILHVGADEECDIQVSPEHAGKIAELALEKHVPIILDISSFLDESKAKELLLETARHLFAKEKKKKQPFLLVVEEIHEWLPEGGGLDECGRMLIKVAKRGRKHGLGVCGISQRPADVKKDFITQCDWLVWHRLTWGNDTKVVQRILGSDYADWVEDLNDGEGFLMTDWDEEVRQVQFQRKRTFDAGATPGLEDFERPELKSVSGDLVSDLERISEDKQARKSRIAELERELKDKELRIEQLEEELKEARDLSQMAEKFSRAMMAHATGRPFREDVTGYQSDLEEAAWGELRDPPRAAEPNADLADEPDAIPDDDARPRPAGPEMTAPEPTGDATGGGDESGSAEESADPDAEATTDTATDGADSSRFTPAYEPWPDEDGATPSAGSGHDDAGALSGEVPESEVEDVAPAPTDDSAEREDDGSVGGVRPDSDGIIVPGDDAAAVDDGGGETAPGESGTSDGAEPPASAADGGDDIIVSGEDTVPGGSHSNGSGTAPSTPEPSAGSTTPAEDGGSDRPRRRSPASGPGPAPDGPGFVSSTAEPADEDAAGGSSSDIEREVVVRLRDRIEAMDPVTRGMLAYYREHGPATPLDAQVAAGGDGERTRAYGRNRTLREAGLVAHAGRGNYGYALPSRVDAAHDGRLDEASLAAAVESIEETFVERADAPWPGA